MERKSPDAFPKFRLRRSFVDAYASRRAPFGFNGLGELVYQRTYSRIKGEADFSPGADVFGAEKEQWRDTVERVGGFWTRTSFRVALRFLL